MTAKEFMLEWSKSENNLNQISELRIEDLGLMQSTTSFLKIAGLPRDAPPFLSFCKDSDDIYEGVHRLTQIYDFLEPGFNKFVVIGSCSNGDPIVINNENNDRIEVLDHENNFSSEPFNSDISSMAGCLIAYRTFVQVVQMENGEDAYLNSNFSDEQVDTLRKSLRLADSEIFNRYGFWSSQLEMDLAMRNENLKQ